MKNIISQEYHDKTILAQKISNYYREKLEELHVNDFARIKSYLETYLPENLKMHIERGIIFAHLGFENFLASIARGGTFSVVSGLNPSSPLHLGHKVLFDILLILQKLGADIFIPITNDESYLDGKTNSLAESRRIAYEEIIPSIIAFGFNPDKTHIFVCSDYPDIYNFAINISKNITGKFTETVFGQDALDNSGKIFYRSAVQLAQILLPQLSEFGGLKNVLIPVGIDQHPYVLLARDAAKKMKFTPPSELIFKFQNSLTNPFEKMSGSKPKTAIYLNDSPEIIRTKINKAYTGAVSSLQEHQKLGGIPEACSVFSLLYFHHPDNKFVKLLETRYKNGQITMKELKEIATDFIIKIVTEHKNRKEKVTKKEIDKYIMKKPLRSFLLKV